VGNSLLVKIDARNVASGFLRDPQSRPARAARYVQQTGRCREIEPADEGVLLRRGQPTRLADVFAESLAPNGGIEPAGEAAVARP
jgi:hypothetical protein